MYTTAMNCVMNSIGWEKFIEDDIDPYNVDDELNSYPSENFLKEVCVFWSYCY